MAKIRFEDSREFYYLEKEFKQTIRKNGEKTLRFVIFYFKLKPNFPKKRRMGASDDVIS